MPSSAASDVGIASEHIAVNYRLACELDSETRLAATAIYKRAGESTLFDFLKALRHIACDRRSSSCQSEKE